VRATHCAAAKTPSCPAAVSAHSTTATRHDFRRIFVTDAVLSSFSFRSLQ
jgi:hypothetical protein